LTIVCILSIAAITDLIFTEGKQKPEDLIPGRQPRNRHDSDSDSDVSPPRVNLNTKRGLTSRHDSDSDVSPPRVNLNTKRGLTSRHDSDSDNSEKCSREHRVATRHDSDSDTSEKRAVSDRLRHDSDSDPSPPRRTLSESHNINKQQAVQEQPYKRHLSPAVLETARRKSSPQRKRRNSNSSDSDLSPRRVGQQQSSRSRDVLQRHSAHRSDSDLSPERCDAKKRKTVDDQDLSPVRKPVSVDNNSKAHEKATKTLSGAKAGLQSASDMKLEAKELRKREEEAFAKVSCIKDSLIFHEPVF
jgi:hypothetical protein